MKSSDIKEFAVYVLIILLLNIFPIGIVKGFSMLPSYQNNDVFVIQRFFSHIERGDVVISEIEIYGVRKTIIKRVAGVPGDEIIQKQRMLFINGAYIRSSTDYAECGYKLKEDEYFILGDNKNNSCDSTFFGPILRESIVGKVII